MSATNYITPAGHKKLTDELDFLQRVERPRVVREVQDAAAQGDRSENAEYIYGKRRLREIDRRLRFLADRLKDVTVVDPAAQKGDRVFFGAEVEVEDEDGRAHTWRIVGVDETDADKGMISWRSPIGAALMRKRVGDTTSYRRPDGESVELTVTALRYR
ncbi:MAG: transcription elongation factor GreB [Polyangiales bacterium]